MEYKDNNFTKAGILPETRIKPFLNLRKRAMVETVYAPYERKI